MQRIHQIRVSEKKIDNKVAQEAKGQRVEFPVPRQRLGFFSEDSVSIIPEENTTTAQEEEKKPIKKKSGLRCIVM